jgi:lipoyl(octanoyl) transferase
MEKQTVIFEDLGSMDYQRAWDYQEQLLQENTRRKALLHAENSRESLVVSHVSAPGTADAHPIAIGSPLTTDHSLLTTEHYLLFVEHPPVYTLGKSGNIDNVLISEEMRSAKGIEFFRTNRGGDITFHGPGQLVGYPILDLEKFYTDIGKYLRNIEEVIILTLAEYGIKAGRSAGETGVWIDPEVKGRERKICAIGVRTSRWITMHGFALNVNTNLDYFNFIVPCGISNKQVTSLERELGHTVSLEEVKEKVKKNFEKVFNTVLRTQKSDKS